MASNENFLSRTLTQFFNDYVTYELSKLSDKQVKMNKFYDYVVNYATKHPMAILDSQIKLDNTNIKSIYFNESRWENLEFEIFESNDMEIVINEKHKMAKFSMDNCSDINLIFMLESSKDGFTNQNNFSFKECKFKIIDIRAPLEDKYKFSFKYKLDFLNCEIEKMDRIENKEFNNSLTFENITFKESVNFNSKTFNGDVKFIGCAFKDDTSFRNTVFEKETYFQKCTFNEVKVFIEAENIIDPNNESAFNKTDFSNAIFKDNVYFNHSKFNQIFVFYEAEICKEAHFQNCVFGEIQAFVDPDVNVSPNDILIFNEANFSNVIFRENVYFSSSQFNGAFMLEGSQFDKVANFFKTEFNNVFDFTSCWFREPESVNFTIHEINRDIKTLEYNINKISKQEVEKRIQKNEIKKEYKETEIKKLKIAWAEKLRNSFTVIKHNFLQRSNLIEAQKYKIAEFYAEELRLKYVREMKKNTQKHSCFKNLKTTIGKCWTNIKECTFRFAIINIIITKIYSLISFITPLKATIDYWQLHFYYNTSNHHSDLLKSFHTMLLLLGLFAIFNCLIICGFNYFDQGVCMFDIQTYNAIIKNFIAINKYCLILINFAIVVLFLAIFFVLCIYFQNKIARFVVVSLSYLCSILLLLFSPKSIISITNLFSGNQHILDPLSALSGIYTILFILLIYSLQKTSRRNSIM